jgi:hypothetical protein
MGLACLRAADKAFLSLPNVDEFSALSVSTLFKTQRPDIDLPRLKKAIPSFRSKDEKGEFGDVQSNFTQNEVARCSIAFWC